MYRRTDVNGEDASGAEYLRKLQGAAEDHECGTASVEYYARLWDVNLEDLEEHERELEE